MPICRDVLRTRLRLLEESRNSFGGGPRQARAIGRFQLTKPRLEILEAALKPPKPKEEG
jgi:ABC-type molybdate transport system ATPase subunit